MKEKTTTKREPRKETKSVTRKNASLLAAFNALASMPDEFYAEIRVDPPPEDREGW
jgi:hypothetical protein